VIYVLEIAEPDLARAWFAYDADDLSRKIMASETLQAGEFLIYWSDSEALAAFEGGDARIAGDTHWWARRALYDQLVALEVLADDC
jgi:hypothetical protein